MKWTKKDTENLINLLKTDLSYTLIGARWGLTRSAISGRVNALRKSGVLKVYVKPEPKKKKPATKKIAGIEKIISSKIIFKAPEVILPGKADIVSVRTGQCRFPLSEPHSRMRVCGEPTTDPLDPECNYCAKHYQLTHIKRSHSARPLYRKKIARVFI